MSVLIHFIRPRVLSSVIFLNPLGVASGEAVNVTFGDLVKTYTGAKLQPTIYTNPPKTVTLSCFPCTASQTIYSSMPPGLASTYGGMTYKTNNILWMGDVIKFVNPSRSIESVEFVMLSDAKGSDWPSKYAENSAGYLHTFTVAIYSTGGGDALVYSSQAVLVPWASTATPSVPFKVKVDFPASSPVLAINDAVVLLRFDTSNTVGVAVGPYDKLKMALSAVGPTIGTDLDTTGPYLLKTTGVEYPYAVTPAVPMIQIQATQISTSTADAINAGKYKVKAVVASPDTGEASAYFTVNKANATVTLSNLSQVANGNQKTVTVVTSPVGLANSVTYNGSATAPVAAGRYPVVATVNHMNYTGSTSGELVVNQQFSNWISGYVTGGSVPSGQATDTSDPDKDGVINQLEYAFDTLPGSSSSSAMPALEYSGGVMSVVYRKNTLATDLTYQVQASATLLSSGWTDVTTADTILSTSGYVQTIRATVSSTSDSKRFIRLKVNKN